MGIDGQAPVDMTLQNDPLMYDCVVFTFLGDTLDLLRKTHLKDDTLIYPLSRRASIKDILESNGLPHTEVGMILRDGLPQPFSIIPEGGQHFHIYPVTPDLVPTLATTLRPEPLNTFTFLVDINVGRLAGLLRMAGLDAETVASDADNADTVQRAVREGRILLTRNKDLFKQRRLVFGRLLRSLDPEQQFLEIITIYQLQHQLKPFSRCISCNGILTEVEKDSIIDRLLPLTKKYFNKFKQCKGCAKIYWHGSHHNKMTSKMEKILRKDF